MNTNSFSAISKSILLILITFINFVSSAQSSKNSVILYSPNQINKIVLKSDEGVLTYQVFHKEESILNPSSLGFLFQYKSEHAKEFLFNHAFQLTPSKIIKFKETWKPVWGTDSLIENTYNQTTIKIFNKTYPEIKLHLMVRAYDDGVAFRYLLDQNSDQKKDSIFVIQELTEFNFTQNDSAWFAPAADFAYESIYKNLALSEIKDAATPITICRNNQLTISIHEAALSNYSEFYLKQSEEGKAQFITNLWPEPDGVCVRLQFPFQTPWRVIMITDTPEALIESHLIQNLNEPSKIKNTDWIIPIKFVGVWWGMHIGKYTWAYGENHGATTERTKQYIDFAAQHHINAVLAEGWNLGWETWNSGDLPLQNFSKEYPDFDLEEVVRYGKTKNVSFVSHHETGGNIPEYERQLDSALKLCNLLGIRYLKTGYAGKIVPIGYPHHGQYMVNHFQKVVEMAAKYQICLNVHESIKPTGLDRTWPNLMSQEAIRGNEWNGGYKPTPPSHTTILPFTRAIAGPADYTPGIFKTKHSPEKGKRLYTTRVHQMALMVVLFSPMGMVSDNIENYENQPEFKFMEEVPSSWDATKVIDCHIGEYISIARKKNNIWYVGTITNEKSRVLPIHLNFLDYNYKYRVTIYGDGFENDWEENPDEVDIENYIVTAKDSILVPLSQGSGNVMIIEPLKLSKTGASYISNYNKKSIEKGNLYAQKTFQDLSQQVIQHKGYLCKVTYNTPYNQKYGSDGIYGLTNGKIGNYNYYEEWQGFEETNLKLVIDLETLKTIERVEMRFLDAINDWIFAPKSVSLWGSIDGKSYDYISICYLTPNEAHDYDVVEVKKAIFNFEKREFKYLKIETDSQKTCPEWHYGSGKSCWTFSDEIIIE